MNNWYNSRLANLPKFATTFLQIQRQVFIIGRQVFPKTPRQLQKHNLISVYVKEKFVGWQAHRKMCRCDTTERKHVINRVQQTHLSSSDDPCSTNSTLELRNRPVGNNSVTKTTPHSWVKWNLDFEPLPNGISKIKLYISNLHQNCSLGTSVSTLYVIYINNCLSNSK